MRPGQAFKSPSPPPAATPSPAPPSPTPSGAEALSPWKSHLRTLRKTREGVAEADSSRRAEAAAEAAARENGALMEGVAAQVADARAERDAAMEQLRAEMRAKDGELAARLEAQRGEAVAAVSARLGALEALRAPLAEEAAARLAGLERALDDARDVMDEEVEAARAAVTVAAERTAALTAEARDHGSLVALAAGNQARLEALLGDVEERLDGKVVSHMDDAFEGLKASFTGLFDANSAAATVRNEATQALVSKVAAAGDADRLRIDALERAAAERRTFLDTFTADQRHGLKQVHAAKAKMEADVAAATAALVDPPPSARQRVFIAAGAWAAVLLLAVAMYAGAADNQQLRTAY